MEKDPGILWKTDLSPFLLLKVSWIYRTMGAILLLKKKYILRHNWFSVQVPLGRSSGSLVLRICPKRLNSNQILHLKMLNHFKMEHMRLGIFK